MDQITMWPPALERYGLLYFSYQEVHYVTIWTFCHVGSSVVCYK